MSALGDLPVPSVAPDPHKIITVPPPAVPLVSTVLGVALLSFNLQRYSPSTKVDFDDEYDYIVVGSGSGGSVVASRLSEVPCVSVLLLEAGQTPPANSEVPGYARSLRHTNWDWAYKTTRQRYSAYAMNNRQVPWPSGKAVGGSSILNFMFYTRGNRRNYDDWAASGAAGWSYNDVLPYFIKAEDNKDKLYFENGYHGRGGPLTVHQPWYTPEIKGPVMRGAKYLGYDFVDSNGPRQTGFFDLQATMRGGQRCSAAKAYLLPAENRTNLDIVQGALVRKVIIENRRAVGVQLDHDGQRRIVRARREVILAAGPIKTPQLLMLSGIGPEKHLKKMKIPVVADLPVGNNLQDHATTYMFFEITNKTVQPATAKLATGVPQYTADKSGPLASADFVFLTAFLKDNETHPASDIPNHQFYAGECVADVLHTLGLKAEVYAKTFLPYIEKPMLECWSRMVQPKSRGIIRLKSSDPKDDPIINPNYYKERSDVDQVVAGLKNCIRIANTPPVKNFGVQPLKTLLSGCEKYPRDSDAYLRCYAKSVVITSLHYVGTAKMGDPNDPTTVVDPLLRVKTIDGLRVVDRSVMPIIPSGDIYAPAIMVGEKAADIIKNTIDCDC